VLPPQFETILQKVGLMPGVGPTRLKPRVPQVAVGLLPGRLGVVRLSSPASRRRVGNFRPAVIAYREVPLPDGLLAPSLTRANFTDAGPVEQALQAALQEVAPREERVCMVLPDSMARVSILRFNRMPGSRREMFDLIRFRMQKVLPFKIEEAALDFQLLSEPAAAEPDFLVTLAQRTTLFQYERLLTGMGRLPGLVELETFSLVNLVARTPEREQLDRGDWALVNAAPGYLTVLFFRSGSLCFYRSKAVAEEERAPEKFHAALRRELASCAAFYREHLAGASLERTLLRSVNGESRFLPGLVQEEFACPVAVVDPGKAVTLPPGSDPAEPKWQLLAPALGAALGRYA
jgi:type IV pilus assembly protein PilM